MRPAVLTCSLICWLAVAVSAQDARPAKPTLFWTTPAAVKFQLRRLSNAELLLVDRDAQDAKYVPVWEALLTRPGIDAKVRRQAVTALATLNKTDAVGVLLSALNQAAGQDDAGPVLRDLARLLVAQGAAALAARVDALGTLAGETKDRTVRGIALAAQVVAGVEPDRLWQRAGALQNGQTDLLAGLTLVRDGRQRAAFYVYVKPLVTDDFDEPLQAAAVESLGLMAGHEAEAFATLADLLRRDVQRDAAVRGLLRLATDKWPTGAVGPLTSEVITLAQQTPAPKRGEPSFDRLMTLAERLVAALPGVQAATLRPAVAELRRSIPAPVDPDVFALGREVFNRDAHCATCHQPHGRGLPNVYPSLVGSPWALGDERRLIRLVLNGMLPTAKTTADGEVIGAGAVPPMVPFRDLLSDEEIAAVTTYVRNEWGNRAEAITPQAVARARAALGDKTGYWTRDELVKLYPLEEDLVAAAASAQTRKLVKHWQLGDFEGDLATLGERDFEQGRAVFNEAGCVQCHKLAGRGGTIGPDLTDAFTRWKGDRRGVLNEVLEPSAKVDDKFRPWIITTKDGGQHFGLIVGESGDAIDLVANPAIPRPTRIARSDIVQKRAAPNSMMPKGLLDYYTKEQVLDLLAYLEAGGNASHALFKR